MKLQTLCEMAAKKLCPTCGKSMAANHYWYKGGWRCKKPKDDQQPAPQSTTRPTPTTPTSSTISIDEIRKLVPELERETYGDMIEWQVYEHKGTISAVWDYTFKRSTRLGAYNYNRQRINAANARIKQIADKYPANVVKVHYVTAESARASDEWAEDNGDDSYSEYEQSLSGGVTLKSS